MLGAVINAVAGLIKMKLDIAGRVRAMAVTTVLMLLALLLLLVALGFGLALLYVWLQVLLGTIFALAIIAAACLLLALILFAIAAWRAKSGRKPARHAPPPPPHAEGATGNATTDRMIEEAIASMQQGSRESMLAALSLAVVTGIILGRKV